MLVSFQTGFEFKKRHAFPVISGVVVAAENEDALLEVRVMLVKLVSCSSAQYHIAVNFNLIVSFNTF